MNKKSNTLYHVGVHVLAFAIFVVLWLAGLALVVTMVVLLVKWLW